MSMQSDQSLHWLLTQCMDLKSIREEVRGAGWSKSALVKRSISVWRCSYIVFYHIFQAFHGIVIDVLGIAAGRTKVPTPLQSPTEEECNPLEEPKHLNVSV